MAAAEYTPAQYVTQPTPDLRNATVGPRGYKMRNKRKLEAMEEQVRQQAAAINPTRRVAGPVLASQPSLVSQSAQEAATMQDDGSFEDPVEAQRKRFKHDLTGNGKVRVFFVYTTLSLCSISYRHPLHCAPLSPAPLGIRTAMEASGGAGPHDEEIRPVVHMGQENGTKSSTAGVCHSQTGSSAGNEGSACGQGQAEKGCTGAQKGQPGKKCSGADHHESGNAEKDDEEPQGEEAFDHCRCIVREHCCIVTVAVYFPCCFAPHTSTSCNCVTHTHQGPNMRH